MQDQPEADAAPSELIRSPIQHLDDLIIQLPNALVSSTIMTDTLFNVADKVVLVSGGSRGIGRAIAAGFAARNSKVIITGRDQNSLLTTAGEIATDKNPVASRVCDVAKLQQIQSLVTSVQDEYGRIDVLVNVAGVNIRQPTDEFDEQQYDYVTDINQKGVFFLTQQVGKFMRAQKSGSIINIDSLNTYAPVKNVVPYAMSKNAIVAMTRALALEWGEFGIRVNSIAPGFILTDLTQKLWSDPNMQQWGLRNTPLGRLGEPDDMIGAAIFLGSDASAFMSGQVVRVDGGFTAGLNWPIPTDGGQ